MVSRVAFVVVLVCGLAAQTYAAELRLLVKDPAGGAAANATADLVNDAVHSHQTVQLMADGKYSFKSLPLGSYHLAITQSGFQAVSELIEIRSEVPVVHVVTLSLQPVTSTVTVEDSDTLIDPGKTNSAQYIGSQQIAERRGGTPGRGLIDLIVTQPGWTLEANGILHPRESEYDTQYVVDGFPMLENRSPAFSRPTGADEVESVKVYASGIPAEFGNRLGGVVEVTTARNTSPGFHGTAIVGGGSFGTVNGYLSGQYVAGKTTATLSAEGFLTDRYLDPPVQNNFTNHGSSASFDANIEHDFSDADRVRVSAAHQQTGFLVPNDFLQQAVGQRQDRTNKASEGRVSYQHVFSPTLLGALRGSVRDVTAALWSNPLADPILAEQNRSFREGYLSGNLSGHLKSHEWKAGAEARYASIHEQFGYQIRNYNLGEESVFDQNLPASFVFKQRHPDREQAAYVQDTWRYKNLTINAGLRFDHYSLLVDETGWSPRLGVSWMLRSTGTLFHGSYDRTFGTPPFENVLVSAAAAQQFGEGFYLNLRPSRGNYYEGGLTQALGKRIRLDANYFLRKVNNFEDDDLLLNTGVSFPISYQHATVRGTEVKLDVPRWGRFSGFLSYANTIGVAQYPITGGLFLDDNAAELINSHDRFPVSQDQRNTASARIRYQIHPRLWTAWSANYSSGLPADNQLPGSNKVVLAEFGQSVVSRVNFDRSRVRPTFSLDTSLGVDVWKREKHSITFQADGLNLTNRVNLINFASLLSGTALAPPRSFSLRIRADF